jgi:hypothetical protein
MYENIAVKLQIPPETLAEQSVRLFLQYRLRLIESQLFTLAQKYGVRTVGELDELVQQGSVHEEDAFEDYFEFDNLEAEQELLQGLLRELN